jgi:hypothetical protein
MAIEITHLLLPCLQDPRKISLDQLLNKSKTVITEHFKLTCANGMMEWAWLVKPSPFHHE